MNKYVVYVTYRVFESDERTRQAHFVAYGDRYQDAIRAVKVKLPPYMIDNQVSLDVRAFGESRSLIGTEHDQHA